MEPAYLGAGSGDWVKSYQIFGFYDIGKVWNVADPSTGITYSQSLASAGFGTRLMFDRNVTATLEAAFPLTKPVASYQAGGNGYDARILGSLVARF
jgi:hemolysin activation/secretion protein